MTPPKPCKFHRRFSPNKRVCSMTWEFFTDDYTGGGPSKQEYGKFRDFFKCVSPHFSHCGVNRRGLCGFDGCLLAEPCGMVAPKALGAVWVCVSPWAGR